MKSSQSAIWRRKRLKKYKKAKSATGPSPLAKKKQPSHNTPVVAKKNAPVSHKRPNLSHHVHAYLSHLKQRPSELLVPKPHVHMTAFGKFLKRYDTDLQLILFPLILLIVLIILSVFNGRLVTLMTKQDPTINQTTALHPYPFVQAVREPQITAQAAIIVDRASQVILFAKNPQLRFSMASTTKIMTALTALDYYKADDILTVKRAGVAGSGLGLYLGEQLRFTDLLYAMLLPSANDAAQTIADNYPGGTQVFIQRMNSKAQKLHLLNTHFADPTGLEDDGDYTTVVDMARLASYAINNPMFVAVTSTKYKNIQDVQFTRQYPLTNLNRLLGRDGVTGIKTGTTEGAGEVLVTSTIKNGHTYIIVVMHSSDRFSDTSMLLNFIDTNVQYIIPEPPSSK